MAARAHRFEGTPRFEVVGLVGQGGMGCVYEVLDREHRAHVALKTLRAPDPESILLLKHGLVLFWALWLSITWLTNACDGLKALGLLGNRWPWASGNYARMVATTQQYALPRWLPALLFLGVVL